MIYSTNKYSFSNTDDKRNDKIPSWMNDNFFDNLQDACMTKTANLQELEPVQSHACKNCGIKLQSDEVNYCKLCR